MIKPSHLIFLLAIVSFQTQAHVFKNNLEEEVTNKSSIDFSKLSDFYGNTLGSKFMFKNFNVIPEMNAVTGSNITFNKFNLVKSQEETKSNKNESIIYSKANNLKYSEFNFLTYKLDLNKDLTSNKNYFLKQNIIDSLKSNKKNIFNINKNNDEYYGKSDLSNIYAFHEGSKYLTKENHCNVTFVFDDLTGKLLFIGRNIPEKD